jgi:divalent metal cation (Fe/Co/Zn/Cd) transporter
MDLVKGFHGDQPKLNVDTFMASALGLATLLKLVLFVYCYSINLTVHSDMLGALAEDHLNDVMSNSVALLTAAAAFYTSYWWLDAAGAILISCVIIFRWVQVVNDQVIKHCNDRGDGTLCLS